MIGIGIKLARRMALGSGGVSAAPVGINLLTAPDNFADPAWVKSSVVVVADNAVGPTVATDADTVTSSVGANQGLYQLRTVLASTAYTYSQYVRLGTMTVANFKQAFYDATNAAFIAQDIVPDPAPSAGGFTRLIYTFTTPVGCVSVRVYPFRNTAAVSGTFILSRAKFELGSVATAY